MDTGLQKVYIDIINLKQGKSVVDSGLQRFESKLKLEEWRGDRVPG